MVGVRHTLLGVFLCGLGAPVAYADESLCARVREQVDSAVVETSDSAVWRRLAPHLGQNGLDALFAKTTDSDRSFEAYLALGFSRKAEALRMLRRTPDQPLTHEGRALALLALGDDTGTSTVTWALTRAPPEVRRRTSRALADMRHHRPRHLLAEVINDPDPEIRMDASRVFLPYRSRRARRNLVAFVENNEAGLKDWAARTLLEHRHRFRPSDLRRLPQGVRGRALVRFALTNHSSSRWLRAYMSRRDPELRQGAIAVLTILEPDGVALAKAVRRGVPGDDRLKAEIATAWGISGHSKGIDEAPFGPDVYEVAIGILWAFSGADLPYRRLEGARARAFARLLEGWMVGGKLSAEMERRGLLAMEAIEPEAGLILARARLLGPPGVGLQSALDVVKRRGRPRDVDGLLGLATRVPTLKAHALAVASYACARAR